MEATGRTHVGSWHVYCLYYVYLNITCYNIEDSVKSTGMLHCNCAPKIKSHEHLKMSMYCHVDVSLLDRNTGSIDQCGENVVTVFNSLSPIDGIKVSGWSSFNYLNYWRHWTSKMGTAVQIHNIGESLLAYRSSCRWPSWGDWMNQSTRETQQNIIWWLFGLGRI